MVLSKAGVLYKNVVKPLRRLTSATSNAINLSHKRQNLTTPSHQSKPRPTETLKAKTPTIQDGRHLGEATVERRQRTWRAQLQNPLDVILKDGHVTLGQPVHLFSQTLSRPFSTCAVNRARREPPEKKPSTTLIELPKDPKQRRMALKPLPLTPALKRQKESGPRKYRRMMRDKIMRKGPNFNIRRQNRLCMQPCGVQTWSINTGVLVNSRGARGNTVPSDSETKKDADVSAKDKACNQVEEVGHLSCDSGCSTFDGETDKTLSKTNTDPFLLRERVNTWESLRQPVQDAASVSGSQVPRASGAEARDRTQLVVKTARADLKIREAVPIRVMVWKKARGCDVVKAADDMRINLTEALQGFKCSVWNKALTGSTSDASLAKHIMSNNLRPVVVRTS